MLEFKEKVVRDPFNALSNWNDKDGDLDHCSWFGVYCSDGNVIILYVSLVPFSLFSVSFSLFSAILILELCSYFGYSN